MRQRKISAFFRRWRFLLIIAALLLGLVLILFIPWNIGSLSSHPRPVRSYDEAVQRIEALRAQEPADMNPVCRLQFMTHGQKAGRVILLVHGYTSCPQQFHELGQQFYDLGYNVLIPPLPHHGLADRLTDKQSQLTADELTAYADEMVDIAHGLGDQVAMAGISGGGVTAAWAAQNRSDLDLAMIISPAFGFTAIPTALTTPVSNLFSVLPESYEWWDPVRKSDIGPSYAYPRYSRHALTQILRLGLSVQVSAQNSPPGARALLVVTNANEPSVNNELTAQVAANWRAHHAQLTAYEFDASLGLPHDLIDPSQADQRVDLVYPQLIDLVTR